MRACKWEFGGQVGAVHIEQQQVKKVRAKARYWLPPRQRMDQVAPYNQPGSLPTAEHLQGSFEARVAHRISPRPQTVLRTTLASRPPSSPIRSPQSGSSHLLPGGAATGAATGATGVTRGGRRRGEGVPVPRHTPGTKARRSVLAMGRHSRQTRAGRGAGLHNSLAMEREKRRRCLASEGP